MKLEGKSIFDGVAMGQAVIMNKDGLFVTRRMVTDTNEEIARYKKALEKTDSQLEELFELAKEQVGEEQAAVFKAYKLVLKDSAYSQKVIQRIEEEQINAEFALGSEMEAVLERFRHIEDELIRARSIDMKDVADKILANLMGKTENAYTSDESVILFADDISPAELIKMDKTNICGFVLRKGSETSHTSILTRIMNIPMLINVDFPEDISGKNAILDTEKERVIIEPEREDITEYLLKKQNEDVEKKLLLRLKGTDNVTLDGKHIFVDANIGSLDDIHEVKRNDADGIGLFRSEFIGTELDCMPDEETQFKIYKKAIKRMKGKRVVIRTVSHRLTVDEPEAFTNQIRAVLRASAYGKAALLFPMIVSLGEVRMLKWEVENVKEELKKEGIPFDDEIEIGIMIETPAAAIMSDVLGTEVDFFSVGTNDLTQYTLAVDRDAPDIHDAHNPAIIRLLKMIVNNGHKNGCRVGICGELGAELSMTGILLKIGFDELSVNPAMILKIRQEVRNTDTTKVIV